MKSKDQQLLEEAYQSIYEANLLTKAIDKGKEMLGMGPSKPLTFDQAEPIFVQALQKLGLKTFPYKHTGDAGVTAEWEGHASPWYLSKEHNRFFPNSGGMARPNGHTLPDITKNDNGQNQYLLTDKNLNAVIKQTKESIPLTKKAIEQYNKDAPEREAHEQKVKQQKSDAFWAQRERSYADTKSPEQTSKLISAQRQGKSTSGWDEKNLTQ